MRECDPPTPSTSPPYAVIKPGLGTAYVWALAGAAVCGLALGFGIVCVKSCYKRCTAEEGEEDSDSVLQFALSLGSRYVSPPPYTEVYPDTCSTDFGPASYGSQVPVDDDRISTTACGGSFIEGERSSSPQIGATDASLDSDSDNSYTKHIRNEVEVFMTNFGQSTSNIRVDASLDSDSDSSFPEHIRDEVEVFMTDFQQSTSLIHMMDNDSLDCSLSSVESRARSGVPGNIEDQSSALGDQACVLPSANTPRSSLGAPQDRPATESAEEDVIQLPLQRNEGGAAVTDLSHQEICPLQHTRVVNVVSPPPTTSNSLAMSTEATRQDACDTSLVILCRRQQFTDV